MKKFFLPLILVMGWLCILTWPTLAGRQDFVIDNETGFSIHRIYVSHVSRNNWEEDVLGKGILYNGQWKTINFDFS